MFWFMSVLDLSSILIKHFNIWFKNYRPELFQVTVIWLLIQHVFMNWCRSRDQDLKSPTSCHFLDRPRPPLPWSRLSIFVHPPLKRNFNWVKFFSWPWSHGSKSDRVRWPPPTWSQWLQVLIPAPTLNII